MRYCLADPERAGAEGMSSQGMEALFLKLR
jgi:hypothetical protein